MSYCLPHKYVIDLQIRVLPFINTINYAIGWRTGIEPNRRRHRYIRRARLESYERLAGDG
jgi:hypothetical protein